MQRSSTSENPRPHRNASEEEESCRANDVRRRRWSAVFVVQLRDSDDDQYVAERACAQDAFCFCGLYDPPETFIYVRSAQLCSVQPTLQSICHRVPDARTHARARGQALSVFLLRSRKQPSSERGSERFLERRSRKDIRERRRPDRLAAL